MKREKFGFWKKRGFEFITMFVAVISAFALNNWNENRRDSNSENKILIEISNGLVKDLEDIKGNILGHENGIKSCNFFRKSFVGKNLETDSTLYHFFNLTRDFVSVQNKAGYETLKSKGLELIKNDSLRREIISLYEYDFNILRKLEEEYSELQFQDSYFKEINAALAPNFIRDENGNFSGTKSPLMIDDDKTNELLLYLWKIQINRVFILKFYGDVESKIMEVQESIRLELE